MDTNGLDPTEGKRWKIHPNGNYKISDHGDVVRIAGGRGAKVGRTLKWQGFGKATSYYPGVMLYLNDQWSVNKIHNLVAKLFIPNPDNLPHINHIDGKKWNPHYSNLEWCDAKYNAAHARSMGLKDIENSKSSKLSFDVADEIRRLVANGESQASVARKYHVGAMTISRIINRKAWIRPQSFIGNPTDATQKETTPKTDRSQS